MKPIIGISSSYQPASADGSSLRPYVQAIETVGGLPIVLAPVADGANVRGQMELLDGLLLTGGADIDPCYYNEEPHVHLGSLEPERDEYEIKLINLALDRGLPILGVCRGMQLLNVVLGGNLYQDIESFVTGAIGHRQKAPLGYASHSVIIEEGSRAYSILGPKTRVNSIHHQAVKEPGEGLVITGRSVDGIAEALEGAKGLPILAVQWHPESLGMEDKAARAIYQWLIVEAQKNTEA